MNTQQIIQFAARSLAIDPATVFDGGERLDEWLRYINCAIAEVEGAGRWSFTTTSADIETEADEPLLALPTDFAAFLHSNPLSYRNTREKLAIVDGEAWAAETAGLADQTGRPRIAQITFDATTLTYQLRLFPTPDAAYEIHVPYERSLTRAAALGDVPGLPTALHELLAIGTAAIASEHIAGMPVGTWRPKFSAALAQAWQRFGTVIRDQQNLRLRQMRYSATDPLIAADACRRVVLE